MRNIAELVDPPKLERREKHVVTEFDIHLFLDYARDIDLQKADAFKFNEIVSKPISTIRR